MLVLGLKLSELALIVAFAQTFLEECSNIVRDSLKFAIAFCCRHEKTKLGPKEGLSTCFCRLESAGYMPAHKGHGDGVVRVGRGDIVGQSIERRG